jgi:uncharacterized protein YerC
MKRRPAIPDDDRAESASLQALSQALASLGEAGQVRAFLEDLCTPAELEAMADRWRVVPLLRQGIAYREIHERTGVSVTTVFPGEIKSQLHAHERETMPAWYKADEAAPAEELAKRVVDAVAEDKRAVHYPPAVRLLRIVHGVSPRASDLMLRALRGRSAAPRP